MGIFEKLRSYGLSCNESEGDGLKNIANDTEKLDLFARKFWGLPSRSAEEGTYYASTTSINWYGFIERINECVESPTWKDIKDFVKFYCDHYKRDSSSYIALYNEIESQGYSPIFKTKMMKSLYKEKDLSKPYESIYMMIMEFFKII